MNAHYQKASLLPPRAAEGRRPHRRLCAERPAGCAAAQAVGRARTLDPKDVDAFLVGQCRRHGDRVLGQGRSRPGAAHRVPADRRRGTRHRRRQDQVHRRRHRAYARPGPHLRLQWHPARRHAAPPGGGDRAQGADRSRREEAERRCRRSRCRRRHGAAEGRRCGRPLRRSDRRPAIRSEARSQGAAEGSGELHPCRQAAEAARCAGQMHRRTCLYAGFQGARHAARPRGPTGGDRRRVAIGR